MVLVVIACAIWYLQRRLTKNQASRPAKEPITLLGRKALGTKAQLVVVETEGKRYVLGVTEGGITVVDTLDGAGAHTGTMSTATSPLLPAAADDFGRAAVGQNVFTGRGGGEFDP